MLTSYNKSHICATNSYPIQYILYMSSKGGKYSLLDKNQDNDEPDMIEMVDWNTIQNSKVPKTNVQQDISYIKLDDPSTTNNKKVSQKVNQKPNPTQSQAPVYPTYSANPNPNQINMNGTTYRRENAPQPQRASKIPQMKVACNFCTFEQNVPGNTQVYVCCVCNNMNECYPLYGLFVCGRCQGKVCYPFGTSDMIRCTRCGTVNQVPAQPKLNYTRDVQKQPKPSAPVPQKKEEMSPKKSEKQKERKLIDFDEDNIVVLDQTEEPMRPNQEQAKEQYLSFDDVPSPQNKTNKNKQQRFYPDF